MLTVWIPLNLSCHPSLSAIKLSNLKCMHLYLFSREWHLLGANENIYELNKLLWVSPLDGIECLHRADESKFMLVSQNLYVHYYKPGEKCHVGVNPYFTSSGLHVLSWMVCEKHYFPNPSSLLPKQEKFFSFESAYQI